MSQDLGRSCPLRYRYGAQAIARASLVDADVLYVVGGLYGNVLALDAIEAMAQAEQAPVTLCFNGDFNWFNVDDAGFEDINCRVLKHHAMTGNVEAELATAGDDAGCGCAYPDTVDAATVARSNRIHARLKTTAQRFPTILAALAMLPMVARYRVGDCRVGVVHGDAESLAGWRFDPVELDRADNRAWLDRAFEEAQVDVFASTHTCVPALRRFPREKMVGIVVNNGSAGMPNFRDGRYGLITRIAVRPSPHRRCYGTVMGGVAIDALPVNYDASAWQTRFLQNWPAHSAAHRSYFERIVRGASYRATDAFK